MTPFLQRLVQLTVQPHDPAVGRIPPPVRRFGNPGPILGSALPTAPSVLVNDAPNFARLGREAWHPACIPCEIVRCNPRDSRG